MRTVHPAFHCFGSYSAYNRCVVITGRRKETPSKERMAQAEPYTNCHLSFLPCRVGAHSLGDDTDLSPFLEKLSSSGQLALG